MLQLVLGRSGFGKTHHTLELIRQWAATHDATQMCCLLVPEQASFETERLLVRTLGDHVAAKVRVWSFTRMGETLMKSRTVHPLSNGAKMLLMSRAMDACADRLDLFGDKGQRTDTAAALLDIVAECRQCAVSPEVLAAAADTLPEGTLRQKTQEMALLMDTYNALAAANGFDAQESLSELAKVLCDTRSMQGATVFVDGFKSFTVPELQVLKALMAQTEHLTVALCTDRDHDDTHGLDRFSVVMETARRLKRAAEEAACPVAPHTLLMTPHRFKNETLATLEATAFTPEHWDTPPSDAVSVRHAADIYEECRALTQTIRRLMRKDGYRARDIAVVTGDLTEYVGVLDVCFEKAGIPYYLDRRAPIVSEGAVTAVLTAVKIAAGGWRTESLLQLMKTGLLGFSVSSASLLENYVFLWNITGAQFKNEWTAHPRGFSATADERDEARLEHINRLRRRLVRPLSALSKALSEPLSGEDFAKAVYRYIRAARIDRLTKRQIAHLYACGEPALAEHTEQVYAALISLLDDMANVLGDDRLTAGKAWELLHAAAMSTDVGAIPQALDAVQIGAADRMRFASPKAVFIPGANEGIFPALPSSQGLLSDRDRRRLMEAGVPFEDSRAYFASEQQFLAYSAMAAASDRVYISYLQSTPDGERGEMSSICQTVLAHLPFVKDAPMIEDDGEDIETTDEAFERMADGFGAKTPLSRALYNMLWQDERLRGRLRAMTRMAEERPIAFEDSDAARRFFGDRMVLSPSRVERYHQCRFAYYCQYGLKALPRRAAELGALEFGTLTHYVMEHTLPIYIEEGIATIKKARCFDDAKEASLRYVEQEMGGMDDKSERFLYLLSRLQGVCGNFLWQAVRELSQSKFEPVDYELNISLNNEDENAVKPMVFTLPDGAQVSMVGQIDRVDLYDDGNRRFVRVVDYKTGTKTFRLEDVVEGINLQMLIYMMTLWKNGEVRYGRVLPAGLLYMPSKAPMIKAEEAGSEAEHEKLRCRRMRMNGLLLDDDQVLRAMEPGVEGIFIPASYTKSGKLSAASSVATLAQFGALGRRAQSLLTDMAQTLRAGDIDAAPFVTSHNDPCAYCDYRAVCGHEAEDRVREPSFDNAADVLAALESTEEELS